MKCPLHLPRAAWLPERIPVIVVADSVFLTGFPIFLYGTFYLSGS